MLIQRIVNLEKTKLTVPTVFIPKKDQTLRVCIENRTPNEIQKWESFSHVTYQ